MAIIIDLFTKKVLAVNPESVHGEVHETTLAGIDWYSKVMERVEARFGDSFPKHFKTTMKAASKYGQDYPYMWGCTHNVKTSKKRDSRFNSPMPVPCRVNPEVDTLNLSLNHGDPLAWLDLKYRTAYNHVIARQGKPLTITTRSDLIAHDDYVEAMDKRNHAVVIVLSKYDAETTRRREPGAPSNERRMEAYNKLKQLGFNVSLKNRRLNVA